jgi:hypothetical protein
MGTIFAALHNLGANMFNSRCGVNKILQCNIKKMDRSNPFRAVALAIPHAVEGA